MDAMTTQEAQVSFKVSDPDPNVPETAGIWTVSGVAGEGQPSHYDIQDALRSEFPNVDFDSEQGTFFAYCYGRNVAKGLCAGLNERYGSPVTPVYETTPQAVVLTKGELGYLWGLVQARGDLTIEAASIRAKFAAAADKMAREDYEMKDGQ